METDNVVVIGFYVSKRLLSRPKEQIKAFMSNERNIYGRILFTLADYLTKHSKKFDRVSLHYTDEINNAFSNGSLMGMINRSEIDIGLPPLTMEEVNTKTIDFSYPFKLLSSTFVIHKPEYKPEMFGILQTFSLPLWMAIISVLFMMSLLYYATFKRRYSFDKILFHTLAVLLRQSAILKPSSIIEKLLVFSWIVGAMFLCLAYDSVFLSFLAFPPTNPIKDVPQLAKAVKEGHYHCIGTRQSAVFDLLLNSTNENLKIIGQDLNTNNLSDGSSLQDFVQDRSKKNLAFIVETDIVDILTIGKKFVSEDRFLESMTAIPVRKDFCCKKLVEKFVYRLMSSGLYFKYNDDRSFLLRLPYLLRYQEKDSSKRKLTLIDVAPAFTFLIFGHIISFLVFMVEILSKHMKKDKKRKKIIAYKEDSM